MQEMKAYILMGSPRKEGNTQAILEPFAAELIDNNYDCETVWLYDLDISACRACRSCQNDWENFGCSIQDDMHNIFAKALACDLLVLASPIYSWYCTPPVKCVLDRLVYGMNKYYGEEKGPSLWEGKSLATIVTCGYPVEKGADLWEQGIVRYCKHSKLNYLGMLAERDPGYKSSFMDEDKKVHAKAFAQKIIAACDSGR